MTGETRKLCGRFSLFARLLAFLVLIAFLVPNSAEARKRIDADKKYQVMATMITKFFLYIEWPALVVDSDDKKNIDLCFFGEEPFEKKMDVAANLISSKSKIKINVRRDVEIEQIKTCNVAFVSDDYPEQKMLFEEIKKYPILSVTEESDDISNAGIIQFFTRKSLSFRIDNAQAEVQNIKIKASLLKLATEVKK